MKITQVKFYIFLCLSISISSCVNSKREVPELFVKQSIDEFGNKKPIPILTPELVTDALLNDEVSQSSSVSLLVDEAKVLEQRILEERFDVSVNNIPAKIFFVSLVADSGVNIVTHPEIEGEISLELKGVTVKEVLDITQEVYGYEYRESNGIYVLYPRKLTTEIFPIDYPDIQRVGVTDTSVLIGKITSQSGTNNGSSSDNSSGGSSSSEEDSANLLAYLPNEQNNGGPGISPGTRVQTLNKTDFWNALHETLLGVIGGDVDDGDRFVMTNAQAGMVIVKAMPKELNLVRQFLQKSELSVKRQVVLETKILEVQLKDEFESGINWSAIGGQLALDQTVSGTGSLSEILNDGRGVSDVLFTSTFNIADITKLISLLDRQGNVQVLSSPRISTVNNQKAVIRVGSDEFFVTGISNSTTSSAAAVTSSPDIQLSSFFSGISLDVTPQISENGDVIIHVHPLVSTITDQQKDITVGNETFSLPLALRDVRESDSIVRAKNGQVVVLGGLMQESSSDVDTRRGFLGDIPILNILFKRVEKKKVKTELVILMRPIVVDGSTWVDEISLHQERMDVISDQYQSR